VQTLKLLVHVVLLMVVRVIQQLVMHVAWQVVLTVVMVVLAVVLIAPCLVGVAQVNSHAHSIRKMIVVSMDICG
jgi:hypothetical protein